MSFNTFQMAEAATKQVGKYSVFTSNQLDLNYESDNFVSLTINKSKSLSYDVKFDVLSNDRLLTFFDSEEEMLEFFEVFNQDPVYGSGLYACTIHPIDGILDENT